MRERVPINRSQISVFLDKKTANFKKFYLKAKRKFLSHIWLARLGIFLLVLIFLYLGLKLSFSFWANSKVGGYTSSFYNFIFLPKDRIKSFRDRTNVLILGKSGAGHAGADLTDTIILVSFPRNGNSVKFISIPRDIWIPGIRAKINSAYYWGNQKQEKGGLVLVKSTVEEILGTPIYYGLVVDFNAFKEMVNVVGGIEVVIERAFIDEKYPIAGKEKDECDGDKEFKCRYETVSFNSGRQLMDGETALKFVRSRNAKGDEGTDLAREERQQKVIAGIKEKVFSPQILLSPTKLLALIKVLKNSTEGDLDPENLAILLRYFLNSKGNTESLILPTNFLLNPPVSSLYDHQYVFISRTGDWSEVKEWVINLLYQKAQ